MLAPEPIRERREVTLDDKYVQAAGRVYLSGIQALVRLPLMQAHRDRSLGLNTAGLVTGYRGSPLAGYDLALRSATAHLEEAGVVVQGALNEELAATAIWGSQQLGLFPGARRDGVFAIWYGKGPGVDRSGDALKHANMAGAAKLGGVLVVCGDDHAAESSTLAFQSEQAMIAALIPVLNPATVQDYLDFGLHGWAMSRYSGSWVGFKALNDTVASSASVSVDPARAPPRAPADFDMPAEGLNIRFDGLANLVAAEQRVVRQRLEAVRAYARANGLDRTVLDCASPRLGIVTTGKAYLDVLQALDDLGFDVAKAKAAGIRLYKVGLSWPLEPEGLLRFARGAETVLVVEEKRGVVEEQVARLLYNREGASRPKLIGKTDESDRPLLPADGCLDPAMLAEVIADRLGDVPDRSLLEGIASNGARTREGSRTRALPVRKPYYCSGCPHNLSTRVPDGHLALGGIGCHTMALLMPERNTPTVTQMGGEGATWIGQAPFSSNRHVFQNLGDGTYFHSGLLAVRAAVAAGVNITYKILFNRAVAMTGGQPLDGDLDVPVLSQQLRWEGVRKIVVVSEGRPSYARDPRLAPEVELRDRSELMAVQRELAECRGVSVLIYDQGCAAELRRKRKRGEAAEPDKRVFINDLVCEGCGDCNEVSTCVSVEPLETEFGRKRTINQSACNKDFSCVDGYCPSFVTVEGAEVAHHGGEAPATEPTSASALPAPPVAGSRHGYSVLITGIGGTGVITTGALLGMAAHLEGKGVSVLDMAGLAQKNGAVLTHVRVREDTFRERPVRIPSGGADLLLACDMLVAAGAGALELLSAGDTRAVVNSHFAATGDFQAEPDLDFQVDRQRTMIVDAVGPEAAEFFDATKICEALLGDSMYANVFMLGFALQQGLLPVAPASLERAIELNGVAVDANLRALAWGRMAAADRAAVETRARAGRMPEAAGEPERGATALDRKSLAGLLAVREEFLRGYQDAAYARAYRDFVERVSAAERERAPGCDGLAKAVSRAYFKLLAYKDEYEVARLYSNGDFMRKLRSQFRGKLRIRFHLAPQFARPDPRTGRPAKRAFGGWMLGVFKVLALGRRLRGTRLDPFGYMAERRRERELIEEYRRTVEQLLDGLGPDNHALAVEIAALPEAIRGFGDLKTKSIEATKSRERELMRRFVEAPVVSA